MRALSAAEEAGGDRAGEESAALYPLDREQYPFWDKHVDFARYSLPKIERMPTRLQPGGKPDEMDI